MLSVHINLKRKGEGISVDAEMVFEAPFAGEFSFLLAPKMDIKSISTSCGKNLTFEVLDGKEPFRQTNRIVVDLTQCTSSLQISYEGVPEGYHTTIGDDFFAINYYSAWYPDHISVGCKGLAVKFHNACYNHVVNAEYDTTGQFWQYVSMDFDCNILAFKNAKVVGGDMLKLLYTCGNDHAAKLHFDAYNQAAAFCMELFESSQIPKNTVAVLPKGNVRDGYCRKALIVLGGFNPDISAAGHLLAHEIAHIWCNGADVYSWEAWLNETTAEWAALLFQLHIGDEEKFNSIIAQRVQRAQGAPPIKTADGSRPDAVHDKGVALFYQIYKKYGQDAVKTMLKLFNRLTPKTTDAYIKLIAAQLGDGVADMLRNGILI
ncbi:MAG: hypothetical protein FWE21_04310 [Defluviitaleaceae bacterium]|nr:hypothetical protein [Defluviitaleaceae bacterium]